MFTRIPKAAVLDSQNFRFAHMKLVNKFRNKVERKLLKIWTLFEQEHGKSRGGGGGGRRGDEDAHRCLCDPHQSRPGRIQCIQNVGCQYSRSRSFRSTFVMASIMSQVVLIQEQMLSLIHTPQVTLITIMVLVSVLTFLCTLAAKYCLDKISHKDGRQRRYGDAEDPVGV